MLLVLVRLEKPGLHRDTEHRKCSHESASVSNSDDREAVWRKPMSLAIRPAHFPSSPSHCIRDGRGPCLLLWSTVASETTSFTTTKLHFQVSLSKLTQGIGFLWNIVILRLIKVAAVNLVYILGSSCTTSYILKTWKCSEWKELFSRKVIIIYLDTFTSITL